MNCDREIDVSINDSNKLGLLSFVITDLFCNQQWWVSVDIVVSCRCHCVLASVCGWVGSVFHACVLYINWLAMRVEYMFVQVCGSLVFSVPVYLQVLLCLCIHWCCCVYLFIGVVVPVYSLVLLVFISIVSVCRLDFIRWSYPSFWWFSMA